MLLHAKATVEGPLASVLLDEIYGDDLALRSAKFKDLLLEQLSSMTLEEIQDSDARNQIRKQFHRTVNTILPVDVGQISNVYIDQFIIQ